MTTVHILHHGLSFCGMPGVPGDWPKGNLWIAVNDPDRARAVNCAACLAAFERKTAIIGGRAYGVSRYVPGTRAIPCELCEAPTLFAPSSINRPEAANAMFVCIPCAAQHLPGQIQPLTEAQKRELSANGVDADLASKFIDSLVELTKNQ